MTDTHTETATNGTSPPPVRRFSAAELDAMRDPDQYPPVPFGKGTSDVFRHEWAAWIFTAMREHELKGGKPKHFSAWLAECVMANRDK